MIYNLNLLTNNDKLFMIENKACFSLPTSVKISYYSAEWMKIISATMLPLDIEKAKTERIEIIQKMRDAAISDAVPINTSNEIKMMYNKMEFMQTETTENLKEIFLFLNIKLPKLIGTLDSNQVKEYIQKQFHVIFEVFFPHRLTAHEIMLHGNVLSKPSDMTLWNYSIKCVRYDLLGLMNAKSNEEAAILIFNLMKYMDMDYDRDGYTLYHIPYIMNGLDIDVIMETVKKMFRGDLDAMQIIDRVQPYTNDNYFSYLIGTTKRSIEENYNKEKICDEVNNFVLCTGDNILPDNMDMNMFMIEILKLKSDFIKEYMGNNCIIDFFINENELANIKTTEQGLLGKLMFKNGEYRSLTKINGVTYLLFKGNTKLYGISLPAGYQGTRKLIMFADLPKTQEMKLMVGDSLWQK